MIVPGLGAASSSSAKVTGDEAGVRWVEPVHPLGSKSHLVASLAHAQGIGVVAPEFGEVVAGQELAVVALVG